MMCYKSGSCFKARVLFFLCVFISPVFIVSCFPKSQKNAVGVSRDLDKSLLRDGQSSSHSLSCSRSETSSDKISIIKSYLNSLIDSSNVGEFLLKGRCEEENELVAITVNGYIVTESPKCDRGRWEVTLDLTTADIRDRVVFHATHAKERACEEVKVAFIGPKNYVLIPQVDDYYESSFYVMKYEAKVEGRGNPSAKAVSLATDRPASSVTYDEAVDLCRNNGTRYDLIQNSQWQNIALSIEEVGENWSEGRASPSDTNTLNCGVSRGIPREASSKDDDDCATTSCNSGWDINRRTHLLPGGQRIWDICGNVGEIMKDKYRYGHVFRDYVYEMSSNLKKMFGPKKTYRLVNANRRSNTWNLGYVEIRGGKDMIVRGSPGRDAGIFSVDVTSDQADNRRGHGDVGFRCVYIP